jgi:hypothetical protein
MNGAIYTPMMMDGNFVVLYLPDANQSTADAIMEGERDGMFLGAPMPPVFQGPKAAWTTWRAARITRLSVADKLARYLLNPTHGVGGSKAKWFKEALGFTRENASDLARQIRFDAAKAVETGVTQYGTKYNQVISIAGANGRVIDVTFAWIRSNDGFVRLVTAIPTPL